MGAAGASGLGRRQPKASLSKPAYARSRNPPLTAPAVQVCEAAEDPVPYQERAPPGAGPSGRGHAGRRAGGSTQSRRNALPSPPQQGPRQRFLRSEGSPRPQRKSTGAGPSPALRWAARLPSSLRGGRESAARARRPARPGAAPSGSTLPRPLRARLPSAPPPRPRAARPRRLPWGAGRGNFSRPAPRLLG